MSPFGSALFTCDFNADRKCGLRDPVWGNTALAAVPATAPIALLLTGLGLLALRRQRPA